MEPKHDAYPGGGGVNAGDWTCPVCGLYKRFQTKALARLHIRRRHGGGGSR